MVLKAVILDLDNTLFPTSRFASRARLKAVKAMIRNGFPEKSPLRLKKRLERIVELYGSNYQKHFARLCEEYSVKPDPRIIAAGVIAYHNTKMRELRPDANVLRVLRQLRRKGLRLHLVSIGNPVKQWEKIHRLMLERHFASIRILNEERPRETDKERAFSRLLRTQRLSPDECVSVGDNIGTDIAPARKLGMIAVRVLAGRHKNEKPRSKEEAPHVTIRSVTQLPEALKKLEKENFC